MQTTHPSVSSPIHHGLPSEAYVPATMPHLLGTGDLTSLFLLNVFWVTNVTPVVAGGTASFTYWLLAGVLFFIPCSVVMAQLVTLYPYAGSIYNWTQHALGSGWSFFVSIIAWLPGVLSMINAAAVTVSCLQALNASWVVPTWQQGLVILAVLVFAGVLSFQRTRTIQHVLNVAAGAMGLATLLIMISALVWLLTGHHSATNFTDVSGWRIVPLGPQTNLALLGSVTLALLGSDMPLAMAGEVKEKKSLTRHLTVATGLTLAGYLLFTFALLVVQGASVAGNTANPISLLIATVDGVLGKGLGTVMAVCLMFYFLMIPVALNVCFARFLVVAAVDQRVTKWFARLNHERVPTNALLSQIVIASILTVLIYFLIPAITVLGKPADLTSEVYNVLGAGLLLVWAVSFMFPFIDLAVLYYRDRDTLLQKRIAPLPLLLICVVSGMTLCAATIYFTLLNSFIPQLIPNSSWWYITGGLAVITLGIIAVFSVFVTSEASWQVAQDESRV